MGLFKQTKAQKEKKAYRGIVAKKTTQAARQAYADEAIKVARERAKAKARRPSIGQILAERVSGSVRSKVSGTKRKAPTRRRRTTVKRTPVRRKAKRKTTRRTPTRRTKRRTTVRKTQAPTQQPINFSEGIFS